VAEALSPVVRFEVSSMVPADNPESDEDLVQRLVAGDHDAMSVLFDRYYAMVMRVALRIVRDAGEAEDVVQVTFTDFYRNAKLFNPDKGSLRTWLLQYAYGRSINRLQGLKSRRHFDQVEYADTDPVTEAGETFRLTQPEARVFVQQALASLNEKQRRVIELVAFCGLTLAEVADVTRESLGNVQHTYYRGIEKLRVAFREKQPSENDDRAAGKKESSGWRLRRRELRGEAESVKTL
jgi:RNA polymerase sigma-70 factor (ECF subfamily)